MLDIAFLRDAPYRQDIMPYDLLCIADQVQEDGYYAEDGSWCDGWEAGEKLKRSAARLIESWVGKVAVPFLMRIAGDMHGAGFRCRAHRTHIEVCGRNYRVTESRKGHVRFLGSCFRVHEDGSFSTKVATKRLVQRLSADLARDERAKQLEAEKLAAKEAQESLGEAMLR